MINIGGVGGAFYTSGLILANFIAKQLYRAALISDLFMVQVESQKPHPSYVAYKKEEDITTQENANIKPPFPEVDYLGSIRPNQYDLFAQQKKNIEINN